jgi:hypothetical protein
MKYAAMGMSPWLSASPNQPLTTAQPYCIHRLALLSLCLSNLDTFLKQLAAAQPGSLSPWSWPGRLAMAGLQLPLLLNLWGFMWPMCHATTFATHHRTYHQVGSTAAALGQGVSPSKRATRYTCMPASEASWCCLHCLGHQIKRYMQHTVTGCRQA